MRTRKNYFPFKGAAKIRSAKQCSGFAEDNERIILGGKELSIHNGSLARIAVLIIHYKLSLFWCQSIIENIFPDKFSVKIWGRIFWLEVQRKAKKLLDLVQLQRNPPVFAKELGIKQQQLVSFSKNKEKNQVKTAIIFDCDPGHDDAIAMMFALGNTDALDIKCFSTVGGNQTLEKTTNNAFKLLELMEQDLPVVKGMSKPLVRALEIADRIHGESGLDGPSLPQSTRKAVDKNILDVYAEILENSNEPITFVVTGPQNNIALFLVARPDLNRISRKLYLWVALVLAEIGHQRLNSIFTWTLRQHILLLILD